MYLNPLPTTRVLIPDPTKTIVPSHPQWSSCRVSPAAPRSRRFSCEAMCSGDDQGRAELPTQLLPTACHASEPPSVAAGKEPVPAEKLAAAAAAATPEDHRMAQDSCVLQTPTTPPHLVPRPAELVTPARRQKGHVSRRGSDTWTIVETEETHFSSGSSDGTTYVTNLGRGRFDGLISPNHAASGSPALPETHSDGRVGYLSRLIGWGKTSSVWGSNCSLSTLSVGSSSSRRSSRVSHSEPMDDWNDATDTSTSYLNDSVHSCQDADFAFHSPSSSIQVAERYHSSASKHAEDSLLHLQETEAGAEAKRQKPHPKQHSSTAMSAGGDAEAAAAMPSLSLSPVRNLLASFLSE